MQSHNRLKNSQWYRDAFEIDSFNAEPCATDVLWKGNHNLDVALNNVDGGANVRVASILTSNELHILALQKAMGRLCYGCVRRFLRVKGTSSTFFLLSRPPARRCNKVGAYHFSPTWR